MQDSFEVEVQLVVHDTANGLPSRSYIPDSTTGANISVHDASFLKTFTFTVHPKEVSTPFTFTWRLEIFTVYIS